MRNQSAPQRDLCHREGEGCSWGGIGRSAYTSFARRWRNEHTAELNKWAVETDLRLKRLYDAIEAGVADLDDPALKECAAILKAIRDQAQVDAERAAGMLESSGQQAITPAMVKTFARTARERTRIDGGGCRRDHLRALAQRVEVAEHELRIIGVEKQFAQRAQRGLGRKTGYARRSQSRSEVADGVGFEPTEPFGFAGFQDQCLKPLGHPSVRGNPAGLRDRRREPLGHPPNPPGP